MYVCIYILYRDFMGLDAQGYTLTVNPESEPLSLDIFARVGGPVPPQPRVVWGTTPNPPAWAGERHVS